MPPTETEQIGVRRVCTNAHPMLYRQGHRALHGQRVGGMKATGQISLIHQRHGMHVITHAPHAEAFTHVAVQSDFIHASSLKRLRFSARRHWFLIAGHPHDRALQNLHIGNRPPRLA